MKIKRNAQFSVSDWIRSKNCIGSQKYMTEKSELLENI